uniref:Uncharacterized protein n=1 Tax=Picea glauca TaxID=3330 RepID=A0A101LYQ0_PICGL|nr:hypothetical protein ABT39_MTgene4781 [Picea glauca]QHR92010.1 hypothetical protein Q903MT_gene6046 [Picea sitchensis]
MKIGISGTLSMSRRNHTPTLFTLFHPTEHRGPTSTGVYSAGPLGLAYRLDSGDAPLSDREARLGYSTGD